MDRAEMQALQKTVNLRNELRTLFLEHIQQLMAVAVWDHTVPAKQARQAVSMKWP